jgi:hypothetical protein
MIYLAGDNNLEMYGVKDLGEMKAVGSSEQVGVVAQLDRMSEKITRRYYLTVDQSLDADCVAQLPEVNTGDPEALLDFILWASQASKWRRFVVIIFGSPWWRYSYR